MKRPPPKRAEKGTIDSQMPLRLPGTLRKRMEKAARAEALSLSEWIRRTCEKALEGQ